MARALGDNEDYTSNYFQAALRLTRGVWAYAGLLGAYRFGVCMGVLARSFKIFQGIAGLSLPATVGAMCEICE